MSGKKPIFTNLKKRFEHIELPAKLLDYLLRSNKSNINQTTYFVFCLLCTRASMVSLLRNTQRRLWHLGWFVCLSVYVNVVSGITTPCLGKFFTARSLDSGLTHLGQIRNDAHWRKTCLCGHPRSSFWGVRTHQSRLFTVVASQKFASVWATGRNSRLFVCRHSQSVFRLSVRNTHLS